MPTNASPRSVLCFNPLWPFNANAFLTNTPPRPEGQLPTKPFSFGFATTASTCGSPDRIHGDSNVRPFSPTCNTSKNDACMRRLLTSSNKRRQLQDQRHWLSWRRMLQLWQRNYSPTSNVPLRWLNALWRRQQRCLPRNNVIESQQNVMQLRQRNYLPTSNIALRGLNALQCWQQRHWPKNNVPEAALAESALAKEQHC
jgi:hypothetical protein